VPGNTPDAEYVTEFAGPKYEAESVLEKSMSARPGELRDTPATSPIVQSKSPEGLNVTVLVDGKVEIFESMKGKSSRMLFAPNENSTEYIEAGNAPLPVL
jgi:hypothetical protein